MRKPSKFSAFTGAIGFFALLVWFFACLVLSNPPEGKWTSLGLDLTDWARLRAATALLAFVAADILLLANFKHVEKAFSYLFVVLLKRPVEVIAGCAVVFVCLQMNAANAPVIHKMADIAARFKLAPAVQDTVKPPVQIGRTVVGTQADIANFANGSKPKSLEQLMAEENLKLRKIKSQHPGHKGKMHHETF